MPPAACGARARASRAGPTPRSYHKVRYACREVPAYAATTARRRRAQRDTGCGRVARAESRGACSDRRRLRRAAAGRGPRRARAYRRARMRVASPRARAIRRAAAARASPSDCPQGGRARSSARTHRLAGPRRRRDEVAAAGSAWRSPGSSPRARAPPWDRARGTPAGIGLPPRRGAGRTATPPSPSPRAHSAHHRTVRHPVRSYTYSLYAHCHKFANI